jgi:hypothetical protein
VTKRTIWPYAVTAAYTAFFLGMASLVVFAFRNPSDLVSKDYYQQELEHQQRIESEQRARDDAHAPLMRYDQSRNAFSIVFETDTPDSGTLTFYRPSDARLDRVIPIMLDESRSQIVDLADFSPGFWRLRMEWQRNGANFFREQTLNLN